MIVGTVLIVAANITKNKCLAVMMLLLLCYCGNVGGSGSPAKCGRHAVMLGILAD